MEKTEFAFQICDQRCEDKRTKTQLQDGIISGSSVVCFLCFCPFNILEVTMDLMCP